MTQESIRTDLAACARCDESPHTDLEFRPLTHPIDCDEQGPMTHWCPCPTNGEPILLRMTDSP